MMFRRAKIVSWLRAALLVILLASLAGCSTRPERTVKASEDWSRGRRVGYSSFMQLPGLAVEPDGGRVYLAWSGREGEGKNTELYVSQLDQYGETQSIHVLPYLFLPRDPRLSFAGEGRVHLLSLARRNAQSQDGVFYMLLGPNGAPVDEGWQVSSPDRPALGFVIISRPDHGIDVFWSEETDTGSSVYHQRLDAQGQPEGQKLAVTEGADPTAQLDSAGTIHLAWLSPDTGGDRRIGYTAFRQGQVRPTGGTEVGRLPFEGVGIRKPLALGLDDQEVYIFWSVEWRSGLAAGSASAPYVHFPIDRPGDARTEQIAVPEASESYDESVGPAQVSQAYEVEQLLMALPASMGRSSGFVEAPRPAPGQRSELAVVVSSQVSYRRTDDTQIILAVYSDGQLIGYELIGRTGSLSNWPVLAADGDDHLHVAWVDYDAPAEHGVYYASTRPAVQTHLDRLTAQDILLGAADTTWGLVSGISLLPLVVMLLLPVVIWCGIFYIFGSDDTLTERGPAIAFAIALLVYFLGKFTVLSPLLLLPPGLSLLPAWLRAAWPFVMLVLVAAAAGLVFWRLYWRRAERPSLFAGVIWFVLSDAVLTVLLYGVSFFGG